MPQHANILKLETTHALAGCNMLTSESGHKLTYLKAMKHALQAFMLTLLL